MPFSPPPEIGLGFFELVGLVHETIQHMSGLPNLHLKMMLVAECSQSHSQVCLLCTFDFGLLLKGNMLLIPAFLCLNYFHTKFL